MAAKKQDRLAEVIGEIETMARTLRADVRRRARQTGLPQRLERAATTLRKRAIMVAAQVEKHAHEARVELTKTAARKPVRRRARRAA